VFWYVDPQDNNNYMVASLVFDEKYKKLVTTTRETFEPFYKICSSALLELLKVKEKLIEEVRLDRDKEFNEAALLLISRSLQHHESIFILIERGLYGDAFSIARNILSDVSMFYYLHHNPELIPMFIKESDTSYQDDAAFKKAFNEGTIQKNLKVNGHSAPVKSFQLLSKTAHASAWGAQLYGTGDRKDPNVFIAKFEPQFESKKALGLLGIILSVNWDYLNMVLWHRHHNKLDVNSKFWLGIQENVKKLRPLILGLGEKSEEILKGLNGKE
jgi:hypothetical protein